MKRSRIILVSLDERTGEVIVADAAGKAYSCLSDEAIALACRKVLADETLPPVEQVPVGPKPKSKKPQDPLNGAISKLRGMVDAVASPSDSFSRRRRLASSSKPKAERPNRKAVLSSRRTPR